MTTNMGKLSVGDWVEVRSKEEILETLDHDGQLDGMPFMPEMFAFCGKRFQVFKRAHKTCDTVFPVRGRRVEDTVHLETRCDGQAHGGCQAGCLIFWKQAWLKPVKDHSATTPNDEGHAGRTVTGAGSGCTEADVLAYTQSQDPSNGETVYRCQATRLPYATSRLEWWDIRQYVEDFTSGNASLWRLFKGFVYSMYYHLSQAGIGLGTPMRWFYDHFYWLWRGTQFPRKMGTIAAGQPTPTVPIGLQPGELVKVKSYEEILQTVDVQNKNRGMYWDAELVPFCGKVYRVLKRVTKIINERTGRMQDMKNPCIILDSVVCEARYSQCRMFCPRSIYPYWREVWLERVASTAEVNEKKNELVQVN